jgi:large subunit ribosomal protein L23
MNIDKLAKVIVASRLSEKTNKMQADGQYVFRVCNCSTKSEIVQAVKLLFGVDVEAVKIINIKGKKRSFRNIAGKLINWKKAYVIVKEGQSIKFGDI